ncbi:hypothetical protein Ahy_A01g001207 isoform E [Arachis hypogaea]|uniref:J domain-containing protein n=1 Tax=Arachis hypogaea TaxID=3818 RepID=A0A445EMM3_ARAHY|nr:hypothetical protein Ahy_A01g001207 isoform E [Arachis hypogaea]
MKYHPVKNPEGREKFLAMQKAYERLQAAGSEILEFSGLVPDIVHGTEFELLPGAVDAALQSIANVSVSSELQDALLRAGVFMIEEKIVSKMIMIVRQPWCKYFLWLDEHIAGLGVGVTRYLGHEQILHGEEHYWNKDMEKRIRLLEKRIEGLELLKFQTLPPLFSPTITITAMAIPTLPSSFFFFFHFFAIF